MTALELKNYFRSTLQVRRTIAQEYVALDAVVDFITQSATSAIPAWDSSLVFNYSGFGDGKYCTYTDTAGHIRFWQSKVDANINHMPPTTVGVTEDAYWIEVSPSDGSAIHEWYPGVYFSGLQIVYFDVNGDGTGMDFFKLAEVTRPFHSHDFLTELAAGSWQQIGGPVKIIFDATTAPLVLDLLHYKDAIFEGSASIGANKTFQFDNESDALRMKILFTLTAAVTLTFPPNVKMLTAEFGWTSVSHQWAAAGAGEYEAELVKKGANWLMRINGPY